MYHHSKIVTDGLHHISISLYMPKRNEFYMFWSFWLQKPENSAKQLRIGRITLFCKLEEHRLKYKFQ